MSNRSANLHLSTCRKTANFAKRPYGSHRTCRLACKRTWTKSGSQVRRQLCAPQLRNDADKVLLLHRAPGLRGPGRPRLSRGSAANHRDISLLFCRAPSSAERANCISGAVQPWPLAASIWKNEVIRPLPNSRSRTGTTDPPTAHSPVPQAPATLALISDCQGSLTPPWLPESEQ